MDSILASNKPTEGKRLSAVYEKIMSMKDNYQFKYCTKDGISLFVERTDKPISRESVNRKKAVRRAAKTGADIWVFGGDVDTRVLMVGCKCPDKVIEEALKFLTALVQKHDFTNNPGWFVHRNGKVCFVTDKMLDFADELKQTKWGQDWTKEYEAKRLHAVT